MDSRLRQQALGGLKATAWLVDRITRPDPGAVILLYHQVGAGTALELDLDLHLFADQLGRIAATGRAASLDEVCDELTRSTDEEQSSAAPPIALTFDDGTWDFVDNVVPLLVEHDIPATVYVATDFIEQQRPFAYGARPASWAGLSEAVSTGLVTVGSHTHTHAVLRNLPLGEIGGELDRSRELIEDRLGVAVDHFAYPKGQMGSIHCARLVAERFRTAAVGGGRVNVVGETDLQRLHRTPIQQADGMRWFNRKLVGGLSFEGSARETLNRVRYARKVV